MTFVIPEPFAWNFCGICGDALIIAHDGQSEKPHCPKCRRFYYRNPVPAACCFVRRGEDELLFAQRAVHPCYGEWCLPGGFVEIDETTHEAALRELREETSLCASNAKLIGVSTKQSPISGSIMVLGYVIEEHEWEGDLVPDTDAMDLRFYKRHERPPLPFSVHRELIEIYDSLYHP